MGRLFLEYVEAEDVHCCAECGTHLAAHDTIISKAFQGRHGRAYLFSDVVNINSGPTENRLLLTGLHVVADIFCNACDTRLGWKYVEAFEENQKYKEGKFILEKSMILKEEEVRRKEEEQEVAGTMMSTGPDDASVPRAAAVVYLNT
uniref:Protein yippee-like n=2 Tax=Coccolithus braarudii TaxID=221442 RepID=A0A7S0PYG5_9EUKA|mmetsp:Transcript_22373/g.48291  ORF Transcript_22373/g.48291 Transcript_22373/m.48291 type:complete len:147 (+) Transcript_22373:239-679(+)